jgi:hypothetical protein
LVVNGQDPVPSGADKPALTDGFESGLPRWREEELPSDADFLLRVHRISDVNAREGRSSERFEFEAGPGSVLYYSYALPKIAVTADLSASVFAYSNRTGARLYGHVVLPNDKDPETGRPSFLLVAGTAVDSPNRWQRLELAGLPLALERQARVLRAGTNRQISLEGAYLDRLVVNLYGGAGDSEVSLDELTVEPVLQNEDTLPKLAADPASNPADLPKDSNLLVKLAGNQLERAGNAWFPRAIAAPAADMQSLRRAGFDLIEVPDDFDPGVARKAAELGYLLMPRLDWDGADSAETVFTRMTQFPNRDNVAFWSLGRELGGDDDRDARGRQLEQVRRLAALMHESESRNAAMLALGTVVDLFPQYALRGRNLDVVAVEPNALASSMDPMSTFHYLSLCRSLTSSRNPNALFWAWLPASAPTALRRAIWGDEVPPAWGWPSVQPEQIRAFTYAALMAGYRGVGFRGDAELARDTGLERLYELTFLIAEIALVEEILARGNDPITQWPAFPPDPDRPLVYNPTGNSGAMSRTRTPTKAVNSKEVTAYSTVRVAAIDTRDGKSKLLLVSDLARGAQWQPPQMAYNNVNLLIPAPESAQAFEIVLGDDVRKLESRRDAGGRRITIPMLNATAMVLVTTDFALVERIREHVMALRPKVVDLAIKQAEIRLDEALRIVGALRAKGVTVRNQDDLLTNNELQSASKFLSAARDARDRADYETAWSMARSVALPIRLVLRAHFDRALSDLDATVAKSLALKSAGPQAPVWVTPSLVLPWCAHRPFPSTTIGAISSTGRGRDSGAIGVGRAHSTNHRNHSGVRAGPTRVTHKTASRARSALTRARGLDLRDRL